MKKILRLLKNPYKIFPYFAARGHFKGMKDETYIKLMYRALRGKKLNLKNPQTFNEKLQWLKLYNRKPEYTTMVDKYEVKKYVSDIIGEEYIIPTLGVWDSFDDIDFDALPDRFVLKCTHDSGGLVICKDKSRLNKEAAKAKIDRCLQKNYYYLHREWPYKNVKPRIIAEQYMEDADTKELRDYKFYCFNGEVKLLLIASNRQNREKQTTFDFFDDKYNHLDLSWGNPYSEYPPEKPQMLDDMIELSKLLSQGMPHIRVDLYTANGRIYFGEYTFFDDAGFGEISPEKWDYTLGEWLKLPEQCEKRI